MIIELFVLKMCVMNSCWFTTCVAVKGDIVRKPAYSRDDKKYFLDRCVPSIKRRLGIVVRYV